MIPSSLRWIAFMVGALGFMLPLVSASPPLPQARPIMFFDWDPATGDVRTWADLEETHTHVACCLGASVAFNGTALAWYAQAEGLSLVSSPGADIHELELPKEIAKEADVSGFYLHLPTGGPAFQLSESARGPPNVTYYQDGEWRSLGRHVPTQASVNGHIAWMTHDDPPRFFAYDMNRKAWIWENRTLSSLGITTNLNLQYRSHGAVGMHLGLEHGPPHHFVPYKDPRLLTLNLPDVEDLNERSNFLVMSDGSVLWAEQYWRPACYNENAFNDGFRFHWASAIEAEPKPIDVPHEPYHAWGAGFLSDGKRLLLANYEEYAVCKDGWAVPALPPVLVLASCLAICAILRRTR